MDTRHWIVGIRDTTAFSSGDDTTMKHGIFAFTESDRVDEYVRRMLADMEKHVDDITIVMPADDGEKRKPGESDIVPDCFRGHSVVRASGNLVDLYAAGARAAFGCDGDGNVPADAISGETVFFSDGFFPFRGFEGIFAKAPEMVPFDAWSLSSRHDPRSAGIKSDNVYNFLLHAYFVVMKPSAVSALLSAEPRDGDPDSVLTRVLSLNKLSLGMLWHTHECSDDDTLFGAAELLGKGFPVVRRELFSAPHSAFVSRRAGTGAAEVLRYLAQHTDGYDRLVLDHVIRTTDPFALATALDGHHLLDDGKERTSQTDASFVFRVSGDALSDDTLRRLEDIARVAEVLIVAADAANARIVREQTASRPGLADVRVVDGAGDSAAPFLAGAAHCDPRHPYIGFARDVPTSETGPAPWLPTAGQVGKIAELFHGDERLGLLVPPVPNDGASFNLPRVWEDEAPLFAKLCGEMGVDASKAEEDTCFSAGFPVWCRRDALKQLFDFRRGAVACPPGPEGVERVLLHGLPFIARHNGYHTGIAYTAELAKRFLDDLAYMKNAHLAAFNAGEGANAMTAGRYFRKAAELLAPPPDGLAVLKKEVARRKADIALIRRSPYFDRKFYVSEHPEVAESGMSPAEHYLLLGWKSGFDPSAAFSTEGYLALNPRVKRAGICPLLHYELRGRPAGKKLALDSGGYFPLSEKRAKARRKGLEKYRDLVEKNKNARILVILHLFYMSAWKEIKEYLKNLDAYGYDLVVTHTDAIVDDEVLEDIRRCKPDVRIEQFPNLGYDVGAFTEILSETDLDRYDIVFKLQSKGVHRPRIFIYGEYMKRRDWFLNLYEGCLGAGTVHVTVDKLMNDPSVGLVAAKNLIVEDPPHKRNMVRAFMEQEGIPIPDKYLFVAGTCFAAKACAMRRIADMRLKVSMYPEAGRGFTLAHKMERVVCLAVLTAGYGFFGNDVMVLRRAWRKLSPFRWRIRRLTGMRLLYDPRFRVEDQFAFFSLEHRLIKKYELVDVRLGDIKRVWRGTALPLWECMPYKYLMTGDPAVYEEYMRQNAKYYKLDMMSRERFDALIRSMDEQGFTARTAVVLDGRNVLLDGQHRCCYLLYKHGEDFKIPCVRVYEVGSWVWLDKLALFLEHRLSPESFARLQRLYGLLYGAPRRLLGGIRSLLSPRAR